jgi:SAM-dependent methyltransferase
VSFSDHFSCQSTEYSLYRPSYPEALIQYLASLCPSTELAWDCATGNGQAAIALSRYFDHVIACDISEAQISRAITHEKIDYRIASAEQSGIDAECIDLILVAQALHWFDFESFFLEAKRVLKPEGVLAAVSYQLSRINPDIDAVVEEFHNDIIGTYWPPERRHVDNGYRDIPFPLQELSPPSFQIEHDWTLEQFLGYLHSWSAVVYYEKEKHQNPIDLIRKELGTLWDETDTPKRICWPLSLRIGKFTLN